MAEPWPEEHAGLSEFITDLEGKAGVSWFDYQWDAFLKMAQQAAPQRRCLYYTTGAGKSLTALVDVLLTGANTAVVIAPPSTHPAWQATASRLGMSVECMSHAKFRMKDTKLSRTKAVIADEVHLFGGHKGKGWKKLDTLARHLQAPLIVASATPNYNDAERVYCIQHVLDPHSCKGGYIEFLYRHCDTEANPFGREPIVTGFRNYPDAAAYLSDLEYVDYLPDDLVYTIADIPWSVAKEPALDTYGYDRYRHRIIASIIEERHRRIQIALIDENGYLDVDIYDKVLALAAGQGPVLIFAAHSTVAEALSKNMHTDKYLHRLVTGKTSGGLKADAIREFNSKQVPFLIGTASLATGTDGMDKVCDTLIILDDTDDDALRRQLIGRIMPRGEGGDASIKKVYRFVLSP
jgi:superfamily II DNA or RNA helicase